MTIEQDLRELRALDLGNSVVSLWTLKAKTDGGYSAKSIDFTPRLAEELRTIVRSEIAVHTEVEHYTLLAQCNEASCLHVETDETSFDAIKDLVDQPAEEHRISTKRDLMGVQAYVIRARVGTTTVYGIRKVTDAWRTAKARDLVNVVFRANKLELVEDKSFTLSKFLDFVIFKESVFIFNKRKFESLFKYKVGYENSFSQLQVEKEFTDCFADMAPLVAHVGDNAMHLRRIAVIQQRAFYKDAEYMKRMRQVSEQEQWTLEFDDAGRLIVTEENAKVIMQVLLNHRLYSRLSLDTYDVPSSTAVG